MPGRRRLIGALGAVLLVADLLPAASAHAWETPDHRIIASQAFEGLPATRLLAGVEEQGLVLPTPVLGAMAFLLAFGGVGLTAAGASSIEADEVTRVLTSHEQWIFYWDRGVARPRLGATTSARSPSAILEFMRVGPRMVGYMSNDEVHHFDCEFDVVVKKGGFSFAGCWGSDKAMTYDPSDREYPFKGRVEGTRFWLAPSR
jgi:hypothetical protein